VDHTNSAMSDPNTTPSTPNAPGTPELRPHVFDGIQEYDQRLPNWWLWTFYITIIWFAVYWFLYYQLGWFTTDHDKVTTGIAEIQKAKSKELESLLAKLDDKVLWNMSRDPGVAAEGKANYDKYCVACHAADLTAIQKDPAGKPIMLPDGNPMKLPGQSLVDKEWKYGNTPLSLFRMVQKGTPDKTAPVQMPPWEQVLGPADVAKVVAFVLSHHDEKNPGAINGPGTYMTDAPPAGAPGSTPAPAAHDPNVSKFEGTSPAPAPAPATHDPNVSKFEGASPAPTPVETPPAPAPAPTPAPVETPPTPAPAPAPSPAPAPAPGATPAAPGPN
jgi:cytochrome c oxidase cbb3-type subunit 3